MLYSVIGFCSAAMQIVIILYIKPLRMWDFPGGTSGEEPACQYRTCQRHGISPGWGGSPGEEHGNPLQCSCLDNPMNRGAWRAIVHGVAQSQTQLKQLSAQALPHEPPSSRPSNPCRSSQNARLGSLCYIATFPSAVYFMFNDGYIYVNAMFSIHSTLSFPWCIKSVPYVCVSISFPASRFTSIIFLVSIHMH